jgi:tetraacyldisaccharide 4'-kinase
VNLITLRAQFERWLQRQWQHRGVWAWTMAPLALLFGLILKLRAVRFKYGQPSLRQIKIPILVVGNIYIGGTGKTPAVIALVKQLSALGWHPGVISRGYGTHIGDQTLVGQGEVDPKQFGDEPSLITHETGAPIAVHPNRHQACLDLITQFPQINLVISDDGLQHLRLPRDIELVVQDVRGTGNGLLLPAGPLREPVSRLRDVDALLTRTDDAPLTEIKPSPLLAETHHPNTNLRKTSIFLQIYQFRHLMSGKTQDPSTFSSSVTSLAVTAMAGIANPEKFFFSLQNIGISLKQVLALPDHFSFEHSPFASLDADVIVLTGKDAIKCQDMTDDRLWVAEADMRFSDPEFLPWLDHQLRTKASRLSHD